MLSPKTQTNLENAKSYFEEHLAVGDNHSESEQVVGEWIGTGAAVLDLGAVVGLRGASRKEESTAAYLVAIIGVLITVVAMDLMLRSAGARNEPRSRV